MSKPYVFLVSCFLSLISIALHAQQEFSLTEQLNGKYDFTFIGNTMNVKENNLQGLECEIETSSSATLSLQANDQIEKAYLYWSGSGPGVNTIKLNGQDVTADDSYILNTLNLDFFVAFAEVTQQIQATGNGEYTVSEFDLTDIIGPYCLNATNYGGWTLVIFYENESLPINQLSLFDGFNYISGSGNGIIIGEISITLDNLYVMDNVGAKIGFVAWEGDSTWNFEESLLLNGEKLSDPPLNPEDNIFNSTNSITGSSSLYNMDLDIYDAEDYIQIGDTTAEVKLTSGQDFVLISTIVTKFNNSHPDATLSIEDVITQCEADHIEIFYTVYNNESYNILPANTPIAIYIDGVFVQTVYTQNDIDIDDSESGSVIVSTSGITAQEIEIVLVADDTGDGTGVIFEIDETNNSSPPFFLTLLNPPLFNNLEDLIACDEGDQIAIFDFSDYEDSVKQNSSDSVSFYSSYEDASSDANPITNTSSYTVQNEFPKEIFVRIDNGNCHSITSFLLNIHNCSLTIVIDEIITQCDSNQIEIYFTIFNANSNYILPAGTPIGIYVNGNPVQTIYTQDDVLTNSSINGTTTITLSENTEEEIEIILIINNTENETIIESNVSNPYMILLSQSPLFNGLEDLVACDEGNQTATFDFSDYEDSVKQNSSDSVSFHNSYEDASSNVNPITNTSSYTVQNEFPKEIFVRINNGNCHSITSFWLDIDNCSLAIVIDPIIIPCDADQIEIYYTVFNTSANYILPANTPIRIYANGSFIQTVYTQNNMLPGSSESTSVIITFTEDTEEDVEIILVINITENGIVIEASSESYVVSFGYSPLFNPLEDLISCNIGNQTATFYFSDYESLVKQNESDTVSFHDFYQDAALNINAIFETSSYTAQGFPKEIFVRIDNGDCYSITSFFLNIRNCPPTVYNGISANNDGYNDEFFIEGLYDIFEDFELFVYSRWGVLIWKGNNNTPKWKGEVTRKNPILSENAPEGTYFYVLELNDKDYPEPLQGYLYLTR